MMNYDPENSKKKFSSPVNNSLNYLFYLEDLSIHYGNIKALNSLHLTINRGEKIFLTGPSGAGKTTFLKVLAGHIKASKGQVYRPHLPIGQKDFISTIFQDLKLMENWTGNENLLISYDQKIYGNKKKFRETIEELAHYFDFSDRLYDKVSHYNRGLKQKMAIVRTLLSRPTVLLADEPTSALDKENAVKLYDLLKSYNETYGMTLIWASHNKDLVRQFSGRIIHLENGRLIYMGHTCFI